MDGWNRAEWRRRRGRCFQLGWRRQGEGTSLIWRNVSLLLLFLSPAYILRSIQLERRIFSGFFEAFSSKGTFCLLEVERLSRPAIQRNTGYHFCGISGPNVALPEWLNRFDSIGIALHVTEMRIVVI